MNLPKPCTDCGELTKATRCDDCARRHERRRVRPRNYRPPSAPETRGYDTTWRRLSQRARRLQPYCSDCGATTDLQADHSPEAWNRRENGRPIRLIDIDVVCGDCNRRRGAARGRSIRPPKTTRATTCIDRPPRAERPPYDNTAPLGGIPAPSSSPLLRRPNCQGGLMETVVVNEEESR